MRKPRWTRRTRATGVAFDEKTGAVCDAACRASARRERDLARGLARRGAF